MKSISDIYGFNVFNESVMRERLPKSTYKSLKRTIDEGLPLEESIAEAVASCMKDWATEKGATHFTHWFQPMTGVTAEKHDAFINPTADGKVILEFSGKELIKGEPDASSFPSKGIRSTFEARGYTAWDCTSPAFVKEGILYIPTAFCSYTGEALDKKTPLLRSMEALSKEAIRILRLFGDEKTTKVITTVGAEQEYFLVDQKVYKQRKDLIFTGRTLFGAKPPKGQELEDHYFGNIKDRVANYMKDLDNELWKLGIASKTKHNEVAPGQHELAPVFTTANIATDHNQLVMELMQKIAKRHELECLLHEKPFRGVNGSGKHNNWALSTGDGQNLLDPGETPYENAQFLVFLSGVIKAVDEYADLLRLTIATPGNDHRLGANEAPPAIVSIFLGDELTDILLQLEKGKAKDHTTHESLEIGVTSLPKLPKDTTDRNRTSPFAFTGNKFEFRMPGSSVSIAGANFTLNTIVAEVLGQFADRLEKAADFKQELNILLAEIIKEHKKILFNGNNYSEEWVKEAESRGLYNLKSTIEAIPTFIKEKNKKVFIKHKVLTETEIHSRYEILLENYSKTINIEALTMLDMAKTEILPAAIRAMEEVARAYTLAKQTGLGLVLTAQEELLVKLSTYINGLNENIGLLEAAMEWIHLEEDLLKEAQTYSEQIMSIMDELRAYADKLEQIVERNKWPFPTYSELLFNV